MVTVPKHTNKALIERARHAGTGKGPENRRAQRYPFVASAEIIEVSSRVRMSGRTSDLGLDGCYIDTLSPLPAGVGVIVRIEKNQRQFQSAGKIVYALSGMGLGISFTQMKPDDDAVLREWIAGLNAGEQSPEVERAPSTTPVQKAGPPQAGPGYVLLELIRLMVRKKLIDESEGAALLRQMFGRDLA